MSDLVYCKGNHLEPEMCYCEEYSAPTNVPVGQRELCTECLHGKSKHPRPQQPASVAEPLVPPALNPGALKPSKPAAATAKERSGVTVIYKQSLAQRARQGSELKCEVSTDSRKTVTATRSEVMAGFHPTIKQKVTGSRVVSSRWATASSSLKQQQVQIRVGTVTVLINYLDDKGQLVRRVPPVKTEMSKLKRRGCAHFDEDEPEDNKVDFSFCPDWTFEEVEEYFRRLFPKVFEYLDSVKNDDVKGKAVDNGASWALISKENRWLSVAPEPLPNGKHLERYRGRNNAPLAATNIFIANRKYIPEHICAQWDPDVIIIDIDSEAGEDRNDEPEDSDAPKTARPKHSIRYTEHEEPARKRLRGIRGQPIASTSRINSENKESSSSHVKRKFEFFFLSAQWTSNTQNFTVFASDSDSDNGLDTLPISLKGM
ncbi:uncharacterized protein F5891DRAFT_1194435 [Suillus fuscotomentosus]|uniref:Uncharacterized protein n=1 Tax=Suillus fuscotomentosus TaxID=1912939 RepID=A0AAD4DWD3_9AGAM|nr:uncharacterized protein F5891DRAFT_1194435 [Suillus fuscotomentosus]KAG1895222.1 hypothetical protein F5891DRAFT_1194435 [Suillus fuscotomentosus]